MTKETTFSMQQLGVRGQSEEYKVHTIPTLHLERGLAVGSSFMPSLCLNRLMGQGISLFPDLLGAQCKVHDASTHLLLSSSTEPRQLLCHIWGSSWLSAPLVLLRNEELMMALNTLPSAGITNMNYGSWFM